MIGFCAAGAAAASAAETSISRTVTGAFNTVVIQATNAATAATKAADNAIQGAKKKKSKDAKGSSPRIRTAKDAAERACDWRRQGQVRSRRHGYGERQSGKSGKQGAEKSRRHTRPKDKDKSAAEAGDAPRHRDGKASRWQKLAILKPPARSLSNLPSGRHADIEIAKARCTALLKTVDAVTMPEAPFRSGDCGTLPRSGSSVLARTPEVSLSPPALVTCDMVVALAKWIKERRAAAVPQASRRQRHQDRDHERLFVPQGLWPRRQQAFRARQGECARYPPGSRTNKGQDAVVLSGWGADQAGPRASDRGGKELQRTRPKP